MTREEAIKIIKYGTEISKYPHRLTLTVAEVEEAKQMAIKALEQEPKTGHWIYSKAVFTGEILFSECSACGHGENGCAKRMKYCPLCGVKMVEQQETETWNGMHGQITAPKGTFERIFNSADDDNDI